MFNGLTLARFARSLPRAGCRNSVGLASRRRRFAIKSCFVVSSFPLRGLGGGAAPARPWLFSVSLRSRSFWLPCPPPFGRLRPCRRGPALRPCFVASASAVAAFPFLWGWSGVIAFLLGVGPGPLAPSPVAGWRFLWGVRALRARAAATQLRAQRADARSLRSLAPAGRLPQLRVCDCLAASARPCGLRGVPSASRGCRVGFGLRSRRRAGPCGARLRLCSAWFVPARSLPRTRSAPLRLAVRAGLAQVCFCRCFSVCVFGRAASGASLRRAVCGPCVCGSAPLRSAPLAALPALRRGPSHVLGPSALRPLRFAGALFRFPPAVCPWGRSGSLSGSLSGSFACRGFVVCWVGRGVPLGPPPPPAPPPPPLM